MVIDEAASVEDAIYNARRPSLAVSDGEMWLISTPRGKQGFFGENWELGGEGWHRVKVSATECARIHTRFLEEERAQMGAQWFRQEYMCGFLMAGRGFSAGTWWRTRWTGTWKGSTFRCPGNRRGPGNKAGMSPDRNRFYVGLDLGQRQDPSAGAVVEWSPDALLLRHAERVPL
jgi:hypothetical protein